jgi:hypothetical protein
LFFVRLLNNPRIWYYPACDEVNHALVRPSVHILCEDNDAGLNLGRRMYNLMVFESLRLQVGEGKGVSCLLHSQNGGECCGRAGLMWSIYEAGLKAKAIKELGWKPTKWDKPECSKPDNR